MPHRIIRTEQDAADLAKLILSLPRPSTFEWRKGADRSLDQNSLQWKWAMEAAHQRQDMTPDEVQREWKLRHGVPILREDSESFRQTYDRMIKPLPYSEKLGAMRIIDVSSIMGVRQMSRYLNTIFQEFSEQGIRLTIPDDEPAIGMQRLRGDAKAAPAP